MKQGVRVLPASDGFVVYVDKPDGDVLAIYVGTDCTLNHLGPAFREVGETVWEYSETT